MKQKSSETTAFWQSFLSTQPNDAPYHSLETPQAWGFGDHAQLADELGALVLQGIKTATCSLLWEFEADHEPLPKPGDVSIILNGAGGPLCIIETHEVEMCPFEAVGADFAYDEGEDDRSLEQWREAHWRYFKRVCRRIGRQVSQDMPLVCERFKVIFPISSKE